MAGRSVWVDLLSIFFGIGAWVAVNGLWVELPLIVQELPEKWNLPSYLSVIIQIANIGPLIYSAVKAVKPLCPTVPVIYVILAIGCVSSFLLPFFWDETTSIGDELHSTALFILIFFVSLVDCTSSVLYLPYMSQWKSIYLPSYLVGEGLSGLLPAVIALGQGVGGETVCINVTYPNSSDSWLQPAPLEPNFSIETFFFILFIMMALSSISFIVLETWKSCQSEKTQSEIDLITSVPEQNPDKEATFSTATYAYLLALQAGASMLTNGVMPSIQSYSCGPYGNVTYHLAATLSALANPIAAFLTILIPRSCPRTLGIVCLPGLGIGAYIMATAALSPTPPLLDSEWGSVIVVLSWILFTGLMTFVRVEINNLMRLDGSRSLFWSGVATQGGSFFGSVLFFILINIVQIFTPYYECS